VPAAHDRDYYRSLGTALLLRIAREEGLNQEMAIAIAERLAAEDRAEHTIGQYHFNNSTGDN